MLVRVLFFGVLKEATGRAEELIDVAPQASIANVFDAYRERFATLQARRSSILFARNREFATPDTILFEGDEVAFLPPVSGGANSGPERTTVAITREPVDSRALAEQVRQDCDGAVVVFEGVVRNNTRGRATHYLEYEAYEPLALAQMRRVASEIADQFKVSRLAIVHRLGHLEIGEASVAIVTSAPHRKSAFQAASAAIDRLKREVPIWKKEFFADGEVWVEGEWDEALRSQASAHDTP
jgi:molybdopterin converting factor subunit 1